ncbi:MULTISPECIES: tRNA (adenosine(37)-N6)-threonylcarbamoyltransferase complex ATPase subunit type 1 TsaE [Sphingobacterium]|uniref:tRNA threonylcarbamoyladenosine biosynthesis protein TsaE n=1 Tax=Sphingobacterium populi TaxID=1812824 RepID=A0ABW5UBY9_9SPHI|nr:tRNA (adenosine(37)-N6)-threonylcarbamoyltransferase complex ATPase subunit type 1 TsaE [Sphingobacterium sp. CFCC 11742]
MEYRVANLADLSAVAKSMVQSLSDTRVILFYGDMGAGKTTFIKELCTQLGVVENTSSPTFSIVNEYASSNGPVYHFDFYRLRDEQEAFDMGYEEYLYSGAYCLIEWPEKITNLLPADAKSVHIHVTGPESRLIKLI